MTAVLSPKQAFRALLLLGFFSPALAAHNLETSATIDSEEQLVSSTVNNDDSALSDPFRIWAEAEPMAYRYSLRSGGVFGYTLYKVSVRDGICRAKSKFVYTRKFGRWERVSCDGILIADLIGRAEDQERAGVKFSEISINQEFGFVSYYSAEPDTELTDQSWYFEVTDFRVR
jgi:hypothetical protein